MLDVMFEVPSRNDITSCTVTEETVKEKVTPTLILKEEPSGKKKEESA